MTKFRFRLKGGYVIGSLRIPTECGAVNVQAVGGTKAEALMRAATIAQRISEDPVMAALMPPQARTAIVASKALANAARQGAPALKRLWKKIKGPGKKRLAEALAREAVKEDVSGIRYQTSHSGVRHTNRGAWMEWQDPYHDADDDYDDAEGYDDDYSDIELSGRRKRRRKKKRRDRESDKRTSADDSEAPYDEPQAPYDEPAPPVDDPTQQEPPQQNEPPIEGWDY